MFKLCPSVTCSHGTITFFKVYHGLEKSRFQNHKMFPLYRFCGMRSFFYESLKTESAGLPQLCAAKSDRVTRPLPLRLVRAVSKSQLCV